MMMLGCSCAQNNLHTSFLNQKIQQFSNNCTTHIYCYKIIMIVIYASNLICLALFSAPFVSNLQELACCFRYCTVYFIFKYILFYIIILNIYTVYYMEIRRRKRWWCLKCVIAYLARDIPPFVMYCFNGKPRSSLFIESTNSMMYLMYSCLFSHRRQQNMMRNP